MLENFSSPDRTFDFLPEPLPFSMAEGHHHPSVPDYAATAGRSTAEILGDGFIPISPGSPLADHHGEVYTGGDEASGTSEAEPISVEEKPPLPPPTALKGGSDKPPTIPPEHSTPAENGEGDDASFGVERFRDIPLTPAETLPASLTYQTGLSGAFLRNREYVDRDENSEVIRLQHRNEGGTVDITASKTGALAVTFTNDRGGESYHRYYVGDDNLVYADERDISIIMKGVPQPGEAPDDVIRDAMARRMAAAESIRQQERQQGMTDRVVGNQEVAFINSIIRAAWPMEQTFTDMYTIAERRIHTPLEPTVDDAMWAGLELNSYVRQMLVRERQERGDYRGVLRFIDRDVYDPTTRTRLQVEAGILPSSNKRGGRSKIDDASSAPFVRLSCSRTVGREYLNAVPELFPGELEGVQLARLRAHLTYTAEDGILKCSVETGLFRMDGSELSTPTGDGQRHRITGAATHTRCDRTEARALRNLLRRPLA